MEVYPFHHQNLFFHIITDYDLTFVEIRGILDDLLKAEAFAEGTEEFESGKFYDVRVQGFLYEVDVRGYEVVIYRKTELKE